MRDYKNIDRIFQEKLKDLEVFPPNQSWNSIQKRLAPVSQKKRLPIWFKFASIAALFILFFSIGTIYFIPESEFSRNFLKEKNKKTVIDQKDSAPLTTSNNKTTDKKITAQSKVTINIDSETDSDEVVSEEQPEAEAVAEEPVTEQAAVEPEVTPEIAPEMQEEVKSKADV